MKGIHMKAFINIFLDKIITQFTLQFSHVAFQYVTHISYIYVRLYPNF